MSPNACPRFDHCSAPVCPLDCNWQRCTHLSGERVCGLLCELVKDGGEARLRGCVPAKLVDTLAAVAPALSSAHGCVRRQLRRAALSSSKLASAQRLQNARSRAVRGAHG